MTPVFRVCLHRTIDGEEVVVAIDDVLPHITASAVRAWRSEPLREESIAISVVNYIRKAFHVAKPYAALGALRRWRERSRWKRDEGLVTDAVEGALSEAEENVVEAFLRSPLRSQGTVAGAEKVIEEAIVAALDDAILKGRAATFRL